MRWMRRAAVLTGCVLFLGPPVQAGAASLVPPGKSGADQYFETIPTSAGNAAPPQAGRSHTAGGLSHSPGGRALAGLGQGRTGADRLVRLGRDGQAAAALAAGTAPTKASSAIGNRSPGTGSAQVTIDQPPGQSAASALANTLNGSGGLGLVLPLLLVSALAVAIGIVALRLMRGPGPPDVTA